MKKKPPKSTGRLMRFLLPLYQATGSASEALSLGISKSSSPETSGARGRGLPQLPSLSSLSPDKTKPRRGPPFSSLCFLTCKIKGLEKVPSVPQVCDSNIYQITTLRKINAIRSLGRLAGSPKASERRRICRAPRAQEGNVKVANGAALRSLQGL